MSSRNVSLKKIIDEMNLDPFYLPQDASQIMITRSDVTRPGLQLAGFFDHFEAQRIQIVGRAEFDYLCSLPWEKRRGALDAFLSRSPVCVIFTHGNLPGEIAIELTEKYGIPLLCTDMATSPFISALIAYLSVQLAPMITRHGVFVEVYGEGILIIGESGIGKSETAVELLKRGHRLIADDAVEIRRVSAKTLTGSAPELIRHYIELRGIGIIDVCRIFGMGAVKEVEKIDMIIKLENWVEGKTYSRIGDEDEYTRILDIDIPTTTIPVQPGRNLAVVIEIAAMERRQRLMGYNTAREFTERLEERAKEFEGEEK
jgi:HPr kinase/phosphorylase